MLTSFTVIRSSKMQNLRVPNFLEITEMHYRWPLKGYWSRIKDDSALQSMYCGNGKLSFQDSQTLIATLHLRKISLTDATCTGVREYGSIFVLTFPFTEQLMLCGTTTVNVPTCTHAVSYEYTVIWTIFQSISIHSWAALLETKSKNIHETKGLELHKKYFNYHNGALAVLERMLWREWN